MLAEIPQLLVLGVTSGCIYAIAAVGFSIIYNSTQVINFAQGEFVMIGAMTSAVLMERFPVIVAFPLAVAAGCLAGLVVAICVLIPLRRSTVVTLIIITVGASITVRGLAQLFWGETAILTAPFTGVPDGFGGIKDRQFHFLSATVGAQEIWVVSVTTVLVIGLHLFFKYTLAGQAMRACAMNTGGARLVGISVRRMIVLSFLMAAGLGAVAGVTVSPVFYAQYSMGTFLGLKGFCAAVLGGLGNFGGAVAAGIILGIVESLGSGFISSDFKDAIAFVILILILFVRPRGLLSRGKAEA